MRAIAEFAMRGRTQAVAVATLSAAIPLLFWMSAAVVSLITLRKGWEQGVLMLIWPCLPASVWWVMQGDPSPLLVIVGTFVLALVLRISMSWFLVLMASCLMGLVISGLIPLVMPDMISGVVALGEEQLGDYAGQIAEASGYSVETWLQALIAGVMSSVHLLVMIASLILARWWQSSLYNPGGFKTEFQQLRLPKGVALPLMLIAFFGAGIHPWIMGVMPVLMMPFMFAALALIHWLVAKKELGNQWLVVFYLALFFAGPWMFLLLTVLAIVDSLVNFRARFQAQQNNDT